MESANMSKQPAPNTTQTPEQALSKAKPICQQRNLSRVLMHENKTQHWQSIRFLEAR